MRKNRKPNTGLLLLALAIFLTLPQNAPAASLKQFVEGLLSKTKNIFPGATKEVAAEALEVPTTQQAGKRSLREIFQFRDKLEESSAGLLKDIYSRLKSGHYVPTLGRGRNIDQAMMSLNNPAVDVVALEGADGVGKTQILIGLQERIISGNVPNSLKNAKVIEINGTHAMMNDLSQFESQLTNLAEKHVKSSDGIVILSFSDVGLFLSEDKRKAKTFDLFVEAATRKLGGKEKVRIVVEGTPDNLKLLKDSSLVGRRWVSVELKSLSTTEVTALAKDIGERMKNETGMTISDQTIDEAVRLSETHLRHIGAPKSLVLLLLGAKSLRETLIHTSESPLSAELRALQSSLSDELERTQKLTGSFAKERAIEIPKALTVITAQIKEIDKNFILLKKAQEELEQISRQIKAAQESGNGGKSVDSKLVQRAIELKNQINQITTDELAFWVSIETRRPLEDILRRTYSIDELAQKFAKRLFGQDRGIKAAMAAAEKAKAAYRTSDRPLGSMLLLGPPGTGKTETAVILSDFIGPLMRWDGAEFGQAHQASRLIGAPPGYVGFDPAKGGELPDAIEKLKKLVLLLDEIDQIHGDTLRLLYPLLDAGRITGSNGVVANARDAVFIGTTNLLQGLVDENTPRETLVTMLVEASHGKLTPALLNRIDDIIVYNKLDAAVYGKVLHKEIEKLNVSMAKDIRKVTLTQDAETFILKPITEGTVTGRDLNRMVDSMITTQVNRLKSYGFWRDAKGLDHPLVFRDGDALQIGYDESLGLVFHVL